MKGGGGEGIRGAADEIVLMLGFSSVFAAAFMAGSGVVVRLLERNIERKTRKTTLRMRYKGWIAGRARCEKRTGMVGDVRECGGQEEELSFGSIYAYYASLGDYSNWEPGGFCRI